MWLRRTARFEQARNQPRRASLGVSHADVAVQFGHTDGGALVMSTYGHPSEDLARERLKRAFATNVRVLEYAETSPLGAGGSR